MKKYFLYNAKGYTFDRERKFKILIIAHSSDEAMKMASQFAGFGSWIIVIKDGNKEVILKRRAMEKLFLYKAKGYTGRSFVQDLGFKIFIAAQSIDEAMEIANEFVKPDGWVISIKKTGKEVILKGNN